MKATTTELNTSHVQMLSMPKDVAAVIMDAGFALGKEKKMAELRNLLFLMSIFANAQFYGRP
jgi:hypothetical protein